MKKLCLILFSVLVCSQAFGDNCPDDKPLTDLRGNCHTCEEEVYGVSKKDCERCPNRYFSSAILEECLFKICPSDRPIKTEDGDCQSCDDPLAIEEVSSEECAKCSNRKFENGRCVLSDCPSTEPMRGHRGSCFSCDEEFFMENISADECVKCPNKGIIDGKCSVLECPQDKPVRDLDGHCYSCKNLYSHLKVSAEECAKCPGKQLIDGHCILTECPQDKPIRDLDGECYRDCKSLPVRKTNLSKEECSKCSDRIYEDNQCVFKECPTIAPMRDKKKGCHSCEDEWIVSEISENECAKCTNRKMENGRCSLIKSCTKDKPLRATTGTCFSCDTELFTNFSKENCAKCPNREMHGNECVLIACPEGQIKDEDTGHCFKERKLFIDESIQAGNKPKWDYEEKDIECDYKNVCLDKKKQRINGMVKEEMFDFFTTSTYVNGEQSGIVKFYTQQNEFIAEIEAEKGKEPSIPFGNQNFGIMMEIVARDKHRVLSLIVYLDSCVRAYQERGVSTQTTCQKLLNDAQEPGLVKGKTISVEKVCEQSGRKKECFTFLKVPGVQKKYLPEFKRKMALSARYEENDDELFVYYPNY